MLEHEPLIRLIAFGGVLCVMAAWERLAPRRPRTLARRLRWPGNVAIVVLDTLIVRTLFPAGALGVALSAQSHGWGLLNRLDLSQSLSVIAGVVLLDMGIYLQHAMFHAIPALWRLHRMHHADLDIDVTTGARFHPVEIALSMMIKYAFIAALGISAAALLVFEVLLNATSMFNHSNVRIPLRIDASLRWLIVTPDMHRVHHSLERDETNTNFGFNLSLWDRLFGTYRAQPHAGHAAMRIGIAEFRDAGECNRLSSMLMIPFRREPSAAAPSTLIMTDVAELLGRLAEAEPLTVVDVRAPAEYRGDLGHVPASLNIPLDELSHRLSELEELKDQQVVLVCRTDKRSARAAELLRSAGFVKVRVLRGGMEAWTSHPSTTKG